MKPTDEERRETAEKLRTMCMGGCRYAEQFYELLKEKVMNAWDFHEFEDVADRLADLIEPEPERTCRLVEDSENRTACSECGASYLCMSDASFCPDCGAKVTEEES